MGFSLWDTCGWNSFWWASLSDLGVCPFRIIISRAWEVFLLGLKFFSHCKSPIFWSQIPVLIISPRTVQRILLEIYSAVLWNVDYNSRLCMWIRPFWAVMTRANCCTNVLLSSNSNQTTFSIRTKNSWILISPRTMIFVYWAVPSSSVREFMLDTFCSSLSVTFIRVVLTRTYSDYKFFISFLSNLYISCIGAKYSVLIICSGTI